MNYETRMSNPETGRMFDQLATLIRETIEVPNKMLPARLRDKRMVYGGPTLQYFHVDYQDKDYQNSIQNKLLL